MPDPRIAEVTHIHPKPEEKRPESRRDPTMTGGVKAETPQERKTREEEQSRPKEAPIIQKDVT